MSGAPRKGVSPAVPRYRERYDVIVIGAGLGGLSAALELQQRGLRVALIERLDRVGGLCGTCHHDGYEFVVACNDFGLAMETRLRKLGVTVSFSKPKTLVFHDGQEYTLPPDARTLAKLALRMPDLWRYFSALRRAKRRDGHGPDDIETLVDATVRDKRLNDLLKLPAYLMGVAPRQFWVETLFHEFDFGYGYWQPTTPVGGPQRMAQAMADRFAESGRLMLGTECTGMRSEGGDKVVDTTRGSYRARYVVNAAVDESNYPATFQRGLPVSMYWLVIDKRFSYPAGFHSLVNFPAGISDWFGALDVGSMPPRFGFHVFRSDLSENQDYYTMNLYFYLPRGTVDPDASILSVAERYLFSELEKMLPGIGAAMRRRYFVSPAEFVRRHRLSGRVMPVILPPGFPKPGNYDPFSDTYYAGSAVYPPGDHAGAAARSGAEAADRIFATARLTPMEMPRRSATLEAGIISEVDA